MSLERCPVCNGNGLVSAGFYSHPGDWPEWTTSTTNPETCHSCEGKGWILVPEPVITLQNEAIRQVMSDVEL